MTDPTTRRAYHEAGHAVLSWLMGREIASIETSPRGVCWVYRRPGDTVDELLQEVRASYGGYAAEIVRFDESAFRPKALSRDIVDADAFLRRAFPTADGERLRRQADLQLHVAIKVLGQHWKAVDVLALALLSQSRLSGREVEALIERYAYDKS